MTKSEQVRGLQCLDGKQETADDLACVCIDAVEKDTAFHCEVPITVRNHISLHIVTLTCAYFHFTYTVT